MLLQLKKARVACAVDTGPPSQGGDRKETAPGRSSQGSAWRGDVTGDKTGSQSCKVVLMKVGGCRFRINKKRGFFSVCKPWHTSAQVLRPLRVHAGVRGSRGVEGRGVHRRYSSTILETVPGSSSPCPGRAHPCGGRVTQHRRASGHFWRVTSLFPVLFQGSAQPGAAQAVPLAPGSDVEGLAGPFRHGSDGTEETH